MKANTHKFLRHVPLLLWLTVLCISIVVLLSIFPDAARRRALEGNINWSISQLWNSIPEERKGTACESHYMTVQRRVKEFYDDFSSIFGQVEVVALCSILGIAFEIARLKKERNNTRNPKVPPE